MGFSRANDEVAAETAAALAQVLEALELEPRSKRTRFGKISDMGLTELVGLQNGDKDDGAARLEGEGEGLVVVKAEVVAKPNESASSERWNSFCYKEIQ